MCADLVRARLAKLSDEQLGYVAEKAAEMTGQDASPVVKAALDDLARSAAAEVSERFQVRAVNGILSERRRVAEALSHLAS